MNKLATTMKKMLTRAGAGLVAFMPAIALAQYGQINAEASKLTTFINSVLIPLIFAVALLVFIWGMFRFFVYGGHNEDEQAKGKQLMIWAIAGFVLMVSIWGIVNVIAGGLGFSGESIQNLPNTPTTGGSSGYSGSYSSPAPYLPSDCSGGGPC